MCTTDVRFEGLWAVGLESTCRSGVMKPPCVIVAINSLSTSILDVNGDINAVVLGAPKPLNPKP